MAILEQSNLIVPIVVAMMTMTFGGQFAWAGSFINKLVKKRSATSDGMCLNVNKPAKRDSMDKKNSMGESVNSSNSGWAWMGGITVLCLVVVTIVVAVMLIRRVRRSSSKSSSKLGRDRSKLGNSKSSSGSAKNSSSITRTKSSMFGTKGKTSSITRTGAQFSRSRTQVPSSVTKAKSKLGRGKSTNPSSIKRLKSSFSRLKK